MSSGPTDIAANSMPFGFGISAGAKKCGSPVIGVRTIRLHHLPLEISFNVVTLEDQGVCITWPDGHVSNYKVSWLRTHCYAIEELARRRAQPILWDSSLGANAPTGSLTQAEAHPLSRLRILEAVRDFGFCKITDAPTNQAEAARLIELVGAQRLTRWLVRKTSRLACVFGKLFALHFSFDYCCI